jgi:hypothetical protein
MKSPAVLGFKRLLVALVTLPKDMAELIVRITAYEQARKHII